MVPGKLVWELRPAVPSDKGDAVGKGVASSGARSVMVAGDDLADLAKAPGDHPTRQRAADRALDLARSASSPGQYQPAFTAAAALRMVASNVMVFAGVDPGRATQALREGTGEFQVPDPPPASRSPFRSDRRRPTR